MSWIAVLSRCCCVCIRRRSATSTATRCARVFARRAARRPAARRVASVARRCRRRRSATRPRCTWTSCAQDLGYTARDAAPRAGLRRSPRLSIVALGIGATTAAFSVTDFVLLRPLPFPEPDRLVQLCETDAGLLAAWSCRRPNYRDWKAGQHVVRGIGAAPRRAANLVGGGEPQRLDGRGGHRRSVSDARRAAADRAPLHRRRRSRRRARHAHPQLPAVADAVRRRPGDRRPSAARSTPSRSR